MAFLIGIQDCLRGETLGGNGAFVVVLEDIPLMRRGAGITILRSPSPRVRNN